MYIYVFSIIHPKAGKQYVARVYNPAIVKETVFNHKPTHQEIMKRLLDDDFITIGYQEEWTRG
jgi:hypothetical protein